MGPVTAVPAGSVSLRSVCSELPGPTFLTLTFQSKGWPSCTVPGVADLLVWMPMRWRTVVSSVVSLLVGSGSYSAAATLAVLVWMSPLGPGWSSTSKRR